MQTPNGIRFAIEPAGPAWRWTTFDLSGARLNGGQARSKREAAALVIRQIVRAVVPPDTDAVSLPRPEAA